MDPHADPGRAADRPVLGHHARRDPPDRPAAPAEPRRDHDQARDRHARTRSVSGSWSSIRTQKQDVLARILEAEPIDGVLVFVNTKSTTEPLAEYLSSQGHRTAALSSDVAQSQRERIVQNLRSGKLDVIIATDVAARGLDVQRISHVINYDFPTDSESYVHRIGRTGRAGRSGNAILFLHPRGRHLLRRIEQATRQTIEPMEIPTTRSSTSDGWPAFTSGSQPAWRTRTIETFASLVEQYRQENDVPLEQIAAVLAALAAGDTPLLLTED